MDVSASRVRTVSHPLFNCHQWHQVFVFCFLFEKREINCTSLHTENLLTAVCNRGDVLLYKCLQIRQIYFLPGCS